MSLYLAEGGVDAELSPAQLATLLTGCLERLGPRERVIAVPPDQTRYHSRAGDLTRAAWQHYGERMRCVMPALGTHAAMGEEQLRRMFGDMPPSLFRVHRWRTDIVTLGEVPASFVREQSEGAVDYAWPAQVNRLLVEGGFDLILSIGQVVPHEVIGMANYNKNILVGTGGADSINRSHYLGAVYGMERIMGRADNPVRRVLNYASDHFLGALPIVYVLTVIGRTADGRTVVRGLFVGDDESCFLRAAELSVEVNFEYVEPLRKVVVYLDPHEFQSTWLGNKAIYRTRMALADGGELIIVAPGVKEFGEDRTIDGLIRRYGYHGTAATIEAVKQHPDLAHDLSAAAHLIHGSSEGRFRIVWCPGHLKRDEVEQAGFAYGDPEAMLRRYDPARLEHGWNHVENEDVFYIANPGLGLWAARERM